MEDLTYDPSVIQPDFLNFSTIEHQIVVHEASMPTAALTAVFAKRYGCNYRAYAYNIQENLWFN